MKKKVYNWPGWILVGLYVLGVFLYILLLRTYQHKPDTEASIILKVFGGIFVFFGTLFIVPFYKLLGIATVLNTSSNLTASVRVVSKTAGNTYHKIARTGQRIKTGNLFFVVCEFPDGKRKNFRVKDVNVYNAILTNDSGLLTYRSYVKKGTEYVRFIDFQRYGP